ncbi:hypothetical protein L083_5862 [Actinoplanes sp. N902-109]|nr:hypothetical protein L083_5862 [Actinoplanes sp. N902-109]
MTSGHIGEVCLDPGDLVTPIPGAPQTEQLTHWNAFRHGPLGLGARRPQPFMNLTG